jgi:alpha-1,2-mannosyltransferase
LTETESNAGGGGERVLWTAIASLHRTERDIVAVVYSGDTDVSKEEIIAKVKVSHSACSAY